MEDTTKEDTIEAAYGRASMVFTRLFANGANTSYVEPSLLMNTIVGFLDKLGRISPRDVNIVMFPLQDLTEAKKSYEEILIEYLELSKPLVEDDPTTLSAIENAISFLNIGKQEDL